MYIVFKQVASILYASLVCIIPAWGFWKKVSVFDAFVDGAKDGIHVCLKIFPYVLAMMVGIAMLDASGAIELLVMLLGPILHFLGIPDALLPLGIVRPLSGAAANAALIHVIQQQPSGSWISQAAGTMMGSTETTLYVVAVYFASVNIRRTRYAIGVGLAADWLGLLVSVWICRLLYT